LRIVGGTYGGRKIEVSRGFDSRPTTDFAKEALFNILDNYVDFENITVLDLFAGTGSISFEFASRGCVNIDLVDINGRSVQFISKVTADIGMKGIHAVRMDVFRFIPICKRKYNIIFADPPYELQKISEIPELIFNHDLLLPEGWFILEHGKGNSFKSHPRFKEERKYGSVHFTFFK
jgi:16S rRNA (guanine(966)-N(2))-methyltransferase RsmD